jgi:hypothetical protein
VGGAETDKDDVIWRTLPSKAQFDFEVALSLDPELSNADALRSLIDQKKRIAKSSSLYYAIVLTGAFFLYGLISIRELDFNIGLFRFGEAEVSLVVVSFFVSLTYATMMYQFMASYTLSRVISAAFSSKLGAGRSFYQYYFDASAIWSYPMTPTWRGYSSSTRHILFSVLFILISFLFMFSVFLVCAFSVVRVALLVDEELSILNIVAWMSAVNVVLMTVFSIVYYIVPFKFPFRELPADQEG